MGKDTPLVSAIHRRILSLCRNWRVLLTSLFIYLFTLIRDDIVKSILSWFGNILGGMMGNIIFLIRDNSNALAFLLLVFAILLVLLKDIRDERIKQKTVQENKSSIMGWVKSNTTQENSSSSYSTMTTQVTKPSEKDLSEKEIKDLAEYAASQFYPKKKKKSDRKK